MRLAVVCAAFNPDVTDAMFSRARAYAKAKGVDVAVAVRVAGVFEIPHAMRAALARDDVDAGVALGAVIRGQTKHDEVLMHAVVPRLLALQDEFGKPVGLGIAGPGMTHAQALARVAYAERAIDAVLGAAATVAGLRSDGATGDEG
jgi:6,7-dimethyl-8-ribityllumazine synthase